MTNVDELIRGIVDITRRVGALERIEIPPSSAIVPVYSGTPAAGAIAYWTGAGTVAAGGAVTYSNGNLTIAGTATAGTTLAITRNLTAASTDSPVVSIIEDHASDDQAALYVRQDGSGATLTLEHGAALWPTINHLAAHATIAALHSYQTGKTVYWGDDADTGSYIFRGRKFGVGPVAPTTSVHLSTTATAILLTLENSGSLYPLINHKAAHVTIAAVFNFDTGKDIYWGEDADTGSYIFRGRKMGIGIAPQGKLHIHDGTGGNLFVSKTGIVGSAQVIIPDGTGDILKRVYITGIADDGTTSYGISTTIAVSGTLTVGNVGVSTIQFAVSAGGELSVIRALGSSTWATSISLVWK